MTQDDNSSKGFTVVVPRQTYRKLVLLARLEEQPIKEVLRRILEEHPDIQKVGLLKVEYRKVKKEHPETNKMAYMRREYPRFKSRAARVEGHPELRMGPWPRMACGA